MQAHRDPVRAGLALLLVLTAMASLVRVYEGPDWVAPTVLAAVLAVVIAATSRALRFGWAASLVASLVGLAAYTYTQHLSAGPLVPGPDQLREAIDLFDVGLRQFRDEPAPTAPLDGLLLITSLGAWAVAHVTHEWLVRGEGVGLALLPAGVLWAVPLAVPLPPGRTWPQALPFAAAAAATLLVEADRDLPGRSGAGAPLARRAALGLGAGLGVVALLVAGVAPGVLPGYDAGPWLDLDGSDDPRGTQPIVDIGDRLKLPEPGVVMTVEADRRTYLRLAALETFDGRTWKLGPADQATFSPSPDAIFPADGTLPRETAISEGTPLEVDVTVEDLENIYVPVPYQPVRLDGDGVDRMIYSLEGGFVATGDLEANELGGRDATGIPEGTRYRVSSVLPTPAYDVLQQVEYSAASVARWTQLPRDYPELGAVAEQVYAEAGAVTAVEKAFALQDWFTGEDSPFTYSLQVDALRGDGALQTFVLDTKVGYCEYFATAMAVMLRQTGVPARVSVGFLAGRLTLPADPAVGRSRNTYTVSTTDAHAWVEVLFPGHGWVRFEPTPRSDGATMQPTAEDLDPLVTERERALAAAAEAVAAEEAAQPDAAPSELAPDDPRLGDDGSGIVPDADTATGPDPLALLLVGLVAALGGWWAWRWRGREHHPHAAPRERVLLAQQRLHQRASGYGLARDPAWTPRELAEHWIAEGRVEPAAAERFTALVESAAFGTGPSEADGADAEELALALEADLRRSVQQGDRLLAPLRQPVAQARAAAVRVLRPDREDSA